jgi:perosamine synthetase
MSNRQTIAYYVYEEKIKREKIPYYEPWLGDDEIAQLTQVIRANWISEGAKTREFEARIAQLAGTKYSLAISNCTAALIIGMKSLGIGPGDEVIVPDFTFIATVNSVRLAGATPVLVDIDPHTFTIDPDAARQAITPRTKAIIAVHLYGQAADMHRVADVARRHELAVIEDAAQGLAVQFDGKPVGSFGNVSCFSFFADKSITLGEGGAICTNSDDLIEELLMLKNDGRAERGTYFHPRLGYNLRITELQAAVGLAQLGKLESIIERKRRNLMLYRELLAEVEGVELPYLDPRCFIVPHRVNVLIDDPESLMTYLGQAGIGCRRFFLPVHKQPCYNWPGEYPNSERAFARGLSLPSAPSLTEDQVQYICGQITKFVRVRR